MRNIVDEAIAAVAGVSDDIAHDVGGFTSSRIRALLNYLAARLPEGEAYLEIGIHIGATLVSALSGNKHVRAYACDNWTYETCSEGIPKEVFARNLARHRHELPEQLTIIEDDCFKILEGTPFDRPIGVYWYDGDHSEDSQRLALVKAAPHLAGESIYVVDDFSWPDVNRGTWAGIQEAGFRGVHFRALMPEGPDDTRYHNGIGVFHLSR